MKTVVLRPLNDQVMIKTECSVLDTLLARKCEVSMACGGQGICSTCHVYIREGAEALTPPTEREQRTLALLTGSKGNSRLACQARVIGEGLVVELPEGMFIQSANELETLIGRRSEVSIRHPKDGRVLIDKDKIITRSRILELKDVNFDILEARNQSASI
ncbi:MAG: 2Fe-2S iron-sulfur cluster-binding protein [Blastochloris sp.]|nr:2Fe-2S iron-sulfur cluster-binding protein [Blastochloris sp.]